MKISKTLLFVGLVLICVNLAVLTKYILFKQPSVSYHRLKNLEMPRRHGHQRSRENWVLFASIRQISNSRLDDRYKWENIGGNIAGFVPLGFLLPLVVFRRLRFIGTLFTVAGISLFFELTQLYTGLGVFDVDDLLLNTFGGVIGYLLFLIPARYSGFRRHRQMRTDLLIF